MIYSTKDEEVEEYFKREDLSQSRIKLLLSSVNLFINVKEPEQYYEEKEHLIIGSAVDCKITQGITIFDTKYYVSEVSKPTSTIMSIIHHVFDNAETNEFSTLDQYPEQVLIACNQEKYYTNWKDDTRVTKIVEDGFEYFEDLIKAKNKQILSVEQSELINIIVENILEHSHTRQYFDSKNKDIVFQLPIYFTYDGVECKALLDMVVIDYEKKEILIIDIKTLGDSTRAFPVSLRKRRYDIQAAFYTEAMVQKGRSILESIVSKSLDNFKLSGFKFIVESTTNPGNPLVYNATMDLLVMGKDGRAQATLYKEKIGPSGLNFPKINGFADGVKLYKWHIDNNTEFKNERDIITSSGELSIDWYGIVKN